MSDSTKTAAPKKLTARLHKALENRELVRVRRDITRAERLTGYVVGVGERWLFMACVEDGIALDGFQALRLADVESVKRRKEKETFTRRALDLGGQWPPHAPSTISLDDDATLIGDISRVYPLLVLYVEHQDPGICHVGKALDWSRRGFNLLSVTPDAEWEEPTTRFKFADVTRIDFGGRYEDVLMRLAGPAPTPAADEESQDVEHDNGLPQE